MHQSTLIQIRKFSSCVDSFLFEFNSTVCYHPIKHFLSSLIQLCVHLCVLSGLAVPWTAHFPCPLEHMEMSMVSCFGTEIDIPWTVILPCPLDHIEMATLSCRPTDIRIPDIIAVLVQPLEHPDTSMAGRRAECHSIKCSASLLQPLENLCYITA